MLPVSSSFQYNPPNDQRFISNQYESNETPGDFPEDFIVRKY